MNWKLPDSWALPNNESFYGKKIDIFEHTILEYNYVTPHISSYRNAIDIGAHVGSTTVRYAKDFKNVYAFEPMYFKELFHNTSHLKNVHRYEFALSDREDTITMKRHRSNTGMTMVVAEETEEQLKKRASWFEEKNYTVLCKTLDDFSFVDVDFIKMDTENYVIPILKGGLDTLIKNSPILQIEATKDVNAIDEFLSSIGYTLYDTFSVERFYKK